MWYFPFQSKRSKKPMLEMIVMDEKLSRTLGAPVRLPAPPRSPLSTIFEFTTIIEAHHHASPKATPPVLLRFSQPKPHHHGVLPVLLPHSIAKWCDYENNEVMGGSKHVVIVKFKEGVAVEDLIKGGIINLVWGLSIMLRKGKGIIMGVVVVRLGK
ncbi:hypothetical protein PIB30_036136 [Stylosanthes scabra]|uniref:Uncharacterized protein n=1 Tax=Stylosanthes scabra TaxID=79078 RepID=A0ABU6XDP3_9FABA|nr:hypothetical protein [Stylosanthes scabra]